MASWAALSLAIFYMRWDSFVPQFKVSCKFQWMLIALRKQMSFRSKACNLLLYTYLFPEHPSSFTFSWQPLSKLFPSLSPTSSLSFAVCPSLPFAPSLIPPPTTHPTSLPIPLLCHLPQVLPLIVFQLGLSRGGSCPLSALEEPKKTAWCGILIGLDGVIA